MLNTFKRKNKAGEHVLTAVQNTPGTSAKEAIVHTMPKRFITVQPHAKKAKGVGVLIIASGIAILLGALAVLYYYISNQEQAILVEQPQIKEIDNKTPEEKPEPVEPIKKTVVAPVNITKATGTTPVATTTTPKIKPATTTPAKKIIISTSTPETYKEAKDSDNDGLSDMEEALFGCNVRNSDTDSDGYSDLAEIFNLYNPNGEGKIAVNDGIEKYTNSQYNYSLYYFTSWRTSKAAGDESIIFQTSNKQFMQAIVQPNTKKQTIEDWYKEQFGVRVIKSGQKIYKKGWTGVKSEDNLVAYLTHPQSDYIFVLSYNLGNSDILYYKNIFEMIIKSLEIL